MEREYIACCSSSASMPSNDTVTPNMRTSLGLASQSNPSNGPPSSGPSHHHSISNPGCMASRILSRNANGTIAMTSQPTNESELQLYRVLQRANLLSYYDTFICQGGDDVQQLCEAGEEEFLEIMALVGMASKPLHVRRLQKALQEWVSNPAMFQAPIIPPFPAGATPSGHPMINQLAAVMANRPNSTSLNSQTQSIPMRTSPSTSMPVPSSTGCSVGSTHSSPSPNGGGNKDMFPSQSTSNQNQIAQYINQGSSGMICNEYSQPSSPITLTPVLLDNQIQRLSEVAEMLVKSLPPMDPKPQLGNNKKRISKELEYVMNMPEDDPRRMDEIRKYAAIYGRFDCKRKPEKPLTLHEVSVNEAAAQICKHIPALLSRRDELFPLARQVVRDSGYQYSKGHSRSQTSYTRSYDESDQSNSNNNNKRSRIESSPNQESKSNLNEEERKKRQERLESVVEQLKSLGNQHEEIKIQLQQANDLQNYQVINQLQSELDHISTKQMQLVNEQSEINKQLRRYEKLMGKSFGRFHSGSEVDKGDTDDTDSQFSIYSNESSPSVIQESHHDSRSPPVNQESLSSSDGFSAKMLPTKKTGNTMAASHITKKLVQDTLIDEGLRVVKELTDQINELNNNGVDLRINNKSSTDSSSILTTSLSSNNHNASAALLMNAVNNRCCYKQDAVTTPRPRGRPPKFIDRESFHHQINQISFHHNQMFSPNHLPHHLLANFHASAAVNHHQLLQAAIHTNGFDSNGTNGHFGHSPQNHSPKHNQLNLPSDLSNHNNINSNNINVNNNECNSKISLNNSLDALISLNGNSINNDSPVKQEPFLQLTTINNNSV